MVIKLKQVFHSDKYMSLHVNYKFVNASKLYKALREMFVVNGVCNNKSGNDSTRIMINIIISVAGARTVLQIPLG